MKQKLLDRAIRNLKEFGYPDVNETNIFSDYIYSEFFKRMLKDAKTDSAKLVRPLWRQVEDACDSLLAKIDKEQIPIED
jgi:hypothetical protein